MVDVRFNFNDRQAVRPLHGVNLGPMTKVFTYDARPLYLEAGFPYARLHDVEYPYGSGEFVDIPCIFKDFSADETDPASYNFGLTDAYIEKCIEVGAEPLFRLGVSIEHAPVKRYIYPPADFDKWARICEHIIAHYNEGWADGYRWNIRYWEIWNEPESNTMWLGTPEQFYELYAVTARHLKSRFPDIKVGGSAFTCAHNDFIEGFVKYVTSQSEPIPFDFFSWHLYFVKMSTFKKQYALTVDLLKRYGCEGVENVFDEWNYMRDWKDQADSYVKLKTHVGGAFCAATLAYMQNDTDIALATYYEADVVKEWCGLFCVSEMGIAMQKAKVGALKPFYPFKYFNELYKLGEAVRAESSSENVFATAAVKGSEFAILAANYRNEDTEVTFDLSEFPDTELEVRYTDASVTDLKLMTLSAASIKQLTLQMKDDSFVYIGSAKL